MQDRLAAGCGPPPGVHALRHLKVARLGDNMRQVAVTEGDKVEAQIRFGMEVNGYGIAELVKRVGKRPMPRSTAWWRVRPTICDGGRSCGPAARDTSRSATPHGSSWVCGPFWRAAPSTPSPIRSKT